MKRDFAGARIERTFEIVDLVPGSEVFPAQSHLQRQRPRDLPVVVDERRKRWRVIRGPRAAERAGAGGAEPEEEIGNRVARELAVEGEPAAGRHLGEMLERAVLRLQPEAHVVAPLHPARGIRHADDVFGGALRDAAFAVSAEAAHGESRTAIVQRIGPAGQVSQADVADPVAAVEADGRVEVIRVVVPDADFVDHVLRDDPRVTDGEIPALLGEVGVGEGAGVQLGSLVIHEPLEQVVLRGQHLIRAPGGRIGIVGKVTNREIVVGRRIVRRRDRRR